MAAPNEQAEPARETDERLLPETVAMLANLRRALDQREELLSIVKQARPLLADSTLIRGGFMRHDLLRRIDAIVGPPKSTLPGGRP